MTKRILWTLVLVGVIGLAVAGCEGLPAGALPGSGEPTPTLLPPVQASDQIVAEARLVPVRYVDLSFKTSGVVEEILAQEGELVQAGEVIARLSDQEQMQASVSAAQLELLNAQQALEELSKNVPMLAAQAQSDLAQARDALRVAEYNLSVNQKGQRASQGTIDAAEAHYILAEDAVKQAEGEYYNLSYLPHDDPQRAAALSRLAAARQNRDDALRKLNWYKGEPTELQTALLEADVALAKAKVDEATQRLAMYQQGPDPEQVKLAEARVENARVQLAAAQSAYDNLALLAPFTGTVVQLNIKEGQLASAAAPAAQLVDLSAWLLETTDLTELSVARIHSGDAVEITFDALPEVSFAGKVTRISDLGESKQGDITFTVWIAPENSPEWAQWQEQLRWNMTAAVTIGK